MPNALVLPKRSTVLSPSLKDTSTYNSRIFVGTVTAGLENGKKKSHNQWEELDELEYVAGDDERYVAKEPSIVKPQKPPPILKQEGLKDVRLNFHHLEGYTSKRG